MEDASSPKPPRPRPRPPKLAVLSSQLQLRHQRPLILTPDSYSQPQCRLTPANQHSSTNPPHPSAPKPSPECSMCGDVGLKKELFRCTKCSLRYQHTYCSNWYPKKRSYAGICNWCDTDYRSDTYASTSNAMIKRINTTAASEVIAPLALIKRLASAPAYPPCKINRVNTELQHTDAATRTSTCNQQSQNRNQLVHEQALCKSKQITEAATVTMLAPKENVVEGDCGIVRHKCGDSALWDDPQQSHTTGIIKLVMSDHMADSRIMETFQQRPAADHCHEASIKTSTTQYSPSTAATAISSTKKAARRYKLISDVY